MTQEINKHLIDLVNEFPRLRRGEIAAALNVPQSTFCHWTNKNEKNRAVAPEWTKDVVKSARERLIAINGDRFRPVTAQAEASKPVQQTGGGSEDQLFMVSVPSSKINQFKGVVAMFGGSIVDI